jgi:hypothetical protein
MKIEIDLEKLHKNELTPNQHIYLKLLFAADKDGLSRIFELENEKKIKDDLFKLYQKGFIKLNIEEDGRVFNLDIIIDLISSVDQSVKDYVKADISDYDKFDEFIEEWYALFPKGVQVGRYPVRSGLSGCRTKMLKFVKKHKQYSYDQILMATKKYIESHRRDGFKFMKLANYFIEKDGVSTLEAMLEEGENKPNTPNPTGYGNTRG